MPRLRVVICDDAKAYGLMLAAQLRADPELEVAAVCPTAAACLDELERTRPDVVVLDHVLPGGDSGAVMPELRRRAPGVAVVLISGLPQEEVERTAREVGAQAGVSKASTRDALRRAILAAAGARP